MTMLVYSMLAVSVLVGYSPCAAFIHQYRVGIYRGAHGEEATGTARIYFGKNTMDEAVEVKWQTVDGTATAGSDYVPYEGTFRLEAYELSKSAYIQINDDYEVESKENFYVEIVEVTTGNMQISQTNGQAQLDIIDNDLNGGWGAWELGECSATCGIGTRSEARSCNQPVPTPGALICKRNDGTEGMFETRVGEPCVNQPCPPTEAPAPQLTSEEEACKRARGQAEEDAVFIVGKVRGVRGVLGERCTDVCADNGGVCDVAITTYPNRADHVYPNCHTRHSNLCCCSYGSK